MAQQFFEDGSGLSFQLNRINPSGGVVETLKFEGLIRTRFQLNRINPSGGAFIQKMRMRRYKNRFQLNRINPSGGELGF